MKLKCQMHNRRIVVLESGAVYHRNSDGLRCNSQWICIGIVPIRVGYGGVSLTDPGSLFGSERINFRPGNQLRLDSAMQAERNRVDSKVAKRRRKR